MKLFNARAATDEYMSTHSLTFSTPEMTLKKFALWLGDQVASQNGETVPRLTLFLQDKKIGAKEQNTKPDIDDTFRPSGAVTKMYGDLGAGAGAGVGVGVGVGADSSLISSNPEVSDEKYCIECGAKLNMKSKFCKACGTRQE
jgi:hypothetical protein